MRISHEHSYSFQQPRAVPGQNHGSSQYLISKQWRDYQPGHLVLSQSGIGRIPCYAGPRHDDQGGPALHYPDTYNGCYLLTICIDISWVMAHNVQHLTTYWVMAL